MGINSMVQRSNLGTNIRAIGLNLSLLKLCASCLIVCIFCCNLLKMRLLEFNIYESDLPICCYDLHYSWMFSGCIPWFFLQTLIKPTDLRMRIYLFFFTDACICEWTSVITVQTLKYFFVFVFNYEGPMLYWFCLIFFK